MNALHYIKLKELAGTNYRVLMPGEIRQDGDVYFDVSSGKMYPEDAIHIGKPQIHDPEALEQSFRPL